MDVFFNPYTLAAAALGYLLGSIPFGYLLTRAAGLGDVREVGSGNIGATNVLRTGRKDLAALTLVLDALKGTAAVLLARYLWGDAAAIFAGIGAFLGHIYPVWLGFRGGKGVATYLGCLIGLWWPAALGFAAHMMFLEDYDPSLPPASADGDQLLQVVLNLLRNASEAGRPGGSIRLRTFYEPSLRLRRGDGTRARLPLQVEVVDDGPGLPPDIAADVFEPFVSGRENGTGLGLALVSKLVRGMGGWVSVESAPGRTVFRVSLPVAAEEDAG